MEVTVKRTPDEAGAMTPAYKKMFSHVLKVATQYIALPG
jgi:hypothetical protein